MLDPGGVTRISRGGPQVCRLSAGGSRIRTLRPTFEPTSSPSGTGPALFGEAIADQAASCVEQPSVRPLNGHGDGFGKATSGILIAKLGALRARLCSLATRYRRLLGGGE